MNVPNSNGVFPPQLNSDISIPTCGGKGKRRVKKTTKRRKSAKKSRKQKKSRKTRSNMFKSLFSWLI